MPKARIRLSSTDWKKLNDICSQIKDIALKTGINVVGPIPLPTKRLKVPTRKTPCGAGRETYDIWEMRIHKRVLDVGVDERALHLIMRIPIPKDVNVEIDVME